MKKQGYNARLDESLGERNRKKKTTSKTKRTSRKAATLSPDINQHKRMAMGEDVLTGKMIKKAKGGMAGRRKESEGMEKASGRRKYAAVGTMDKGNKRLKRSKGGRALSPTAINLNMGEPKTKTITARGMGAATRGGQFREVV
jgi:hypothetical protein|tara:strand:- start:2413 stop:2841 length:429 start_codon:yes stop_codon:yes gene_type:complete